MLPNCVKAASVTSLLRSSYSFEFTAGANRLWSPVSSDGRNSIPQLSILGDVSLVVQNGEAETCQPKSSTTSSLNGFN